MNNISFRLNMDDDEVFAFFNILPLARITASEKERKAVMRMMGFTSESLFVKELDSSKVMLEQYSILLYLTHLRTEDKALSNFFKRLTWLDKEMEQRVRDMLWIENDAPSNEELSKWFEVESDKEL